MLISFESENFLSFGFEDTGFTMETGRARGKRNHVIVDKKMNLLRFAAIYGANSSGKSNFVAAIAFARRVVFDGISDNRAIARCYNRTDEKNKDKDTKFKFQFKLNKKVYTYYFGVSLKNRVFTFEQLLCDDKIIFNRNLEKKEFEINIKCKDLDKTKKVEMYFDTVQEINSVLFLKEMNSNKGNIYEGNDEVNILNDIYNIFDKAIHIVTPKTRVGNGDVLFTEANKIEETLALFGFDITKLMYVDESEENIFRGIPEEIVEDIMKEINKSLGDDDGGEVAILNSSNGPVKITYEEEKLKFKTFRCVHGENGEFSLKEESDGLRRLFDLIEIILNPKSGEIYIVDEIDRSLNSLLTKAFIEYYLNTTEEQNSQLIITTHETRLLDLNILRKDEVWMFDKKDGNTKITALTDYEGTIRSDVKLDAAYMDGRYGGTPRISRR